MPSQSTAVFVPITRIPDANLQGHARFVNAMVSHDEDMEVFAQTPTKCFKRSHGNHLLTNKVDGVPSTSSDFMAADHNSSSSNYSNSSYKPSSSGTEMPKCWVCESSEAPEQKPLLRCGCNLFYHFSCHKPFITLEEQR